MAGILTYSDLKRAVAAILHRSDIPDDGFDLANQFAAAQINASLKDWIIVGRSQLTDTERLSTTGPEYLLPDDFQSLEDIYYGDMDADGQAQSKDIRGVITQSDQQLIRQLRGSGNRVNPTSYSISASLNTIIFDAEPAPGAIFQLVYFRYLYGWSTPFDDTKTDRVLVNNPGLFVYAMCQHLAVAYQDIEMAGVYKSQFEQEVQAITNRYIEARNEGPATIQGASSWL